jgi:hypothetical protein
MVSCVHENRMRAVVCAAKASAAIDFQYIVGPVFSVFLALFLLLFLPLLSGCKDDSNLHRRVRPWEEATKKD